jgi:hypothetical protein
MTAPGEITGQTLVRLLDAVSALLVDQLDQLHLLVGEPDCRDAAAELAGQITEALQGLNGH